MKNVIAVVGFLLMVLFVFISFASCIYDPNYNGTQCSQEGECPPGYICMGELCTPERDAGNTEPDGDADGDDDAGPDAGDDAGLDAGDDAGGDDFDAGDDAGPDAGDDAGPDAGDDAGDIGPGDGDVDHCDPNPCTELNKTQCMNVGGSPVCSCDPGYQDNNNNDICEPDCSSLTCDAQGGGHCEDTSGTAVCICDVGYHDENGTCVPDNPFQTTPLVALDGPASGSLQSGSVNTLIQFTWTSEGGPSTLAKFSFKFNFSGAGEVMNLTEFREDGVDITDQVMMFDQGPDGLVVFKQGRHSETDETRVYRLRGTLGGFPSGHSLTTSFSKDETSSPTLDGVMGYIYNLMDAIYDVDTGLCSFDGRSIWGDESAGGLYPNLNEFTCVISSFGSDDFTYLNIQGSASKTLTAP